MASRSDLRSGGEFNEPLKLDELRERYASNKSFFAGRIRGVASTNSAKNVAIYMPFSADSADADVSASVRGKARRVPAARRGTGTKAVSSKLEVTEMDKDLLEAKLDTVRAQNDAKFAEVISELRLVQSRMDGLHVRLETVPSIWQIAGVALTTLGLGVAILAFANDQFAVGVGVSPILNDQAEKQAQVDAAQDERADAVLEALGAIADRLTLIEEKLPSGQ